MGSDFSVNVTFGSVSVNAVSLQEAMRLVGLMWPTGSQSASAAPAQPVNPRVDDKRPLTDRLALALVKTQNKFDSEQDRAAAIVKMLGLGEE